MESGKVAQLLKPTVSSEKKQGHGPFFQPRQSSDLVQESPGQNTQNEASLQKTSKPPVIISPPVQRKCAACEEEEQVQRKEDGHAKGQEEVPALVGEAIDSSGNPLDDDTRSFMENRFGYDFSQVRIHTDTTASRSAEAINALAYTSGNDIVFRQGQYSTHTESGKKLLAHELTHVVQQNSLQTKSVQRSEDEATTAELGIDTRSYSELWRLFQQHQMMGEGSQAIAIAPTLISRMSIDDAREDGASIGRSLQFLNQPDLAMTAFLAAESAWWIYYITEGDHHDLERGLGDISTEVVTMIAAAQSEAAQSRHDNAIRLFGAAHMMIEMQKSHALERLRSHLGPDERIERLSPELREHLEPYLRMSETWARADVTALEEQRLTILDYYLTRAREAQQDGNTELAAEYTDLNTRLNQEIAKRYTLVSGLQEEQIIVDMQPAAPPARTSTTARPATTQDVTAPETETTATTTDEPPGPDETFDTPPPFNNTTVFQYTGNVYGKVSSEQYMVTEVFSRAMTWATNAFGVRNSVIALHVDQGADRMGRYYIAAMDTEFSSSDFRLVSSEDPTMPGTSIVPGLTVLERLGDTRFNLVAAIFRDAYAPPGDADSAIGRLRHLHERMAEEHERGEHQMDAAQVQSTIFDPIDAAMASGDTGTAADLLGNLTADGFAVVSWERKVEYIDLLVQEWTTHRRERAILEIIKSLESRSQLDAVLSTLRDRGIYRQLFEDMDHELWSMLVEIGRKFNSGTPFTIGDFAQLLLEARLVAVGPIAIGPNGPELSIDFISEAQHAAQSFMRFVEGIWDGIVMLLTEPDKIIDGLAQLTKMIVMFELATRFGYPPAVQYINHLFREMGRSIVFGLQGVQITGMADYVVDRVKWAIIWEVASWFVGVGEVTALVRGLGAIDRAAVVLRFARILGLAGRAGEAEMLSARLARVAAAMSRASRTLTTEEHLLSMIAHLPESETTSLARLLRDSGDLPDTITDLASLSAHNSDLGRAASDVLERAETLHHLATNAGGITDEVAEVFARMSRIEGNAGELRRIVELIPEDEAGRFVHAMRRVPAEAIADGHVSRAFLEATASSPQRMNALAGYGYNAYRRLMARAGGDPARLDHYLEALRLIEQEMDIQSRATTFQRLLDDIAVDDAAAWTRLEDNMRSRGVEMPESTVPSSTTTHTVDEAGTATGRTEPERDTTPHVPDQPRVTMDAYETERQLDMAGHAESPDGAHHVEVYLDNTIGRCSPAAPGAKCPLLNVVYRDILDERPLLTRELRELQEEIGRHGDDVPSDLETRLAALEQRMRRLQESRAVSSAPAGWRVQEVGYHDFPDTVPLRSERTILEFPNGERVWRNADGTITQEGELGRRIGRQDFETEFYTGTEMGIEGLEGYERAHAHGQSLGWESPYALYYAPSYVNQVIQNRGIERFLRTLRDRMPSGHTLMVRTQTRPHFGTRRMQTMEYFIDVVSDGQRTPAFRFRIDVDNNIANPTTTVAALEFITPTDPTAQALVARIQALISPTELSDELRHGVSHMGVR